MEEIWKDVAGYEGHYKISNFGRVKSLKKGKERILKLVSTAQGYHCVTMQIDGDNRKVFFGSSFSWTTLSRERKFPVHD